MFITEQDVGLSMGTWYLDIIFGLSDISDGHQAQFWDGVFDGAGRDYYLFGLPRMATTEAHRPEQPRATKRYHYALIFLTTEIYESIYKLLTRRGFPYNKVIVIANN